MKLRLLIDETLTRSCSQLSIVVGMLGEMSQQAYVENLLFSKSSLYFVIFCCPIDFSIYARMSWKKTL